MGEARHKPRLTGDATQTLDVRGRIPCPSQFMAPLREILGVGKDDPVELVVVLKEEDRIGVFPKNVYFEELEALEEIKDSNVNALELLEWRYRTMKEVETDKQNRFKIPESLIKRAKLSGEVKVFGLGDHMEVLPSDQEEALFEEGLERSLRNKKMVKRSKDFQEALARRRKAKGE